MAKSEQQLKEQLRRQTRNVRAVQIIIVLALLAAIGVHLADVVGRPAAKHPVAIGTTTTSVQSIESFSQYELQQYGKECSNYSPSAGDIDFWSASSDSCAPSWLNQTKTIAQMYDQWYGHACGDYSPTQQQLNVFNQQKFHCPGGETKFLPSG